MSISKDVFQINTFTVITAHKFIFKRHIYLYITAKGLLPAYEKYLVFHIDVIAKIK